MCPILVGEHGCRGQGGSGRRLPGREGDGRVQCRDGHEEGCIQQHHGLQVKLLNGSP